MTGNEITRYHISAAILRNIRQPFQNPWLRSCHPKSRCIVNFLLFVKQSNFAALHANWSNFYIGGLSQKSSMHWTWFLQSDENPRSSSYTVKTHHQRLSLTHAALQNQSVGSMWTRPAFNQITHTHNASSLTVSSCNGKMTEKPGFTMQHKVRGVYNFFKKNIPWSIFRTNDKRQSTYRFPKGGCYDWRSHADSLMAEHVGTFRPFVHKLTKV